ncbi:hypothetical protein Tco_1372473, partial [Tanacetum coccineum]
HDALNAPDAELSFHKRSHDNQDPPNNHEEKTKKGYIDQNENHILGLSFVAIANKLKAINQKDELIIVDLEVVLSEAKWNSDEDDVSKPTSFERHMSQNTKPRPSFYNNDFYYLVYLSTEEKYTTSLTKHYAARYYKQGIEHMISDRWCKETHRYHFEALNGIHCWEDSRSGFFKAEMSSRSEEKIYSDLRIKSVVHMVVKKKWGYDFLTSIVVRRFDDQEYEFSYADLPILILNDVKDMYLLQVQDKLHHLPLEFVKDVNALLYSSDRVMIQINGVNQRIPFTMTVTHKRVMYLNQHNVKSLMKLSEVKKFCDGTLVRIWENLIDMVIKNKLGKGNKRLKGKDWTDDDVMKSNKMVKKIDLRLKHREQIRRLEEYVGGRPKTVNQLLL